MSIAALVIMAAVPLAAESEPPRPRGVVLASAQARAEILRPAIVRQREGWQDPGEDTPRPQIVRREGAVLVEFE